MYESFYGLRKKPFSILPDHAFFYAGEKQQKALARFKRGIMGQDGFTLITGDIGTGKTTLIGHLLSEAWEDVTVGQLTNTHPALCDLLQWVLQAFRVPFNDTSEVTLYQTFIDFLHGEAAQGRRVVLIVDEAQYLMPPIIEELRLLANVNVCRQLFQVILVGQPDLLHMLRQPELREAAQRVVVSHQLEPLDREDTGDYIAHRIRVAGGDPDFFEPEARELVHRHSLGVPRVINSICDTTLLYGCEEEQRTIDASLVSEVVFDKVRNALLEAEPRGSASHRESDEGGGNRKNGVGVPTAPSPGKGDAGYEAPPEMLVLQSLGAVPADRQLAPVFQNRNPFNLGSGDSNPRAGRRKQTIEGTYSLIGQVVERSTVTGQLAPQARELRSVDGPEEAASTSTGCRTPTTDESSLVDGDGRPFSEPVGARPAGDPDTERSEDMPPRAAPEKKWDLDGALNALSGWLDLAKDQGSRTKDQ
jgi:general secretion pathway protein A